MATPPRPRTLALLGLTGVALALLLLGWLTGRSDRPRGLQPSPAAREAQAERSPLRAPPSASATTPREVREAAVASAPVQAGPTP